MTAWTDLVKKTYNDNKHKPGYKLGHAMKAAKKVYKKGSHKKHTDTPYKVGGDCGAAPVNPYPTSAVGGGKSRRKSSCGGKGKSNRRTKKCSMY